MVTNNWNVFWRSENIDSIGMRYHHNTVFKIYKRFLDNLKIENPSILELGCGSGEITARILKRYGGSATLIDNSKEAIKVAKSNFKKHGLDARIVYTDLFSLKIKEKFDIVHSEGLIEHFTGKKRNEIVKIHRRYVKNDGVVIISVPRPSWYYKFWRFYLEKRKKWYYGFENPLDKKELKSILEKNGLKVLKSINYSRYAFALAKI
jgi:cyclopropane fatty-acyl-phospholipid synthase-like methyltransferase